MLSDSNDDGLSPSFLSDLMQMNSGEIIEVGRLPEDPYDMLFPVTQRVVLAYANFVNHLNHHPEMLEHLGSIPVTVIDPHAVFVTERNPRTANAVQEVGNGIFVVVSVWISPDTNLANSVHSFRRYGARTMRKVRANHRLLWRA